MYVCMYVCMYWCMTTSMYCLYVCMYVCMYVYIYIDERDIHLWYTDIHAHPIHNKVLQTSASYKLKYILKHLLTILFQLTNKTRAC